MVGFAPNPLTTHALPGHAARLSGILQPDFSVERDMFKLAGPRNGTILRTGVERQVWLPYSKGGVVHEEDVGSVDLVVMAECAVSEENWAERFDAKGAIVWTRLYRWA